MLNTNTETRAITKTTTEFDDNAFQAISDPKLSSSTSEKGTKRRSMISDLVELYERKDAGGKLSQTMGSNNRQYVPGQRGKKGVHTSEPLLAQTSGRKKSEDIERPLRRNRENPKVNDGMQRQK